MKIAISGKIGSGKDTVSDMFVNISNNQFIKTAFAKKVKQIVSILAGVEYDLTLSQEGKNSYIDIFNCTLGELLQKIGTDVMRDNFDKDVWIKALLADIDNNKNYIISDLRFKNEANILKQHGFILIRVNRINNTVDTIRNREHESETNLDDYTDFDYIIENNSTLEDLENKVKNILNEIR